MCSVHYNLGLIPWHRQSVSVQCLHRFRPAILRVRSKFRVQSSPMRVFFDTAAFFSTALCAADSDVQTCPRRASILLHEKYKASGKQSVAEVVQGYVQGDSVTPSVVFCCTV